MDLPVPELLPLGGVMPPSGPADEEWRCDNGELLARGYVRTDGMTLSFPDLGSYRFSAEAGPVSVAPAPGASEESIEGTYWRSVLPFVFQARGLEALHASAARIGGKLAVFCAKSGTGKSTLARALAHRGHAAWADDAVVLDGSRPVPLPFQVKLRRPSAEWFGEPPLSAFLTPPDRAPALGAVFVLERDEDSRLTVNRLSPAAAFPRLLTHAYCFTLADRERTRRMMLRYLDLAQRIPVFELRFRPELDLLGEMAEAVETAIAEITDPPSADTSP